jgi:2-polyprenyl-6-methoxyphenol hydroxylase-like FAD-dependent oxidoreductase
MNKDEVDTLIVGAGPIGLLNAIGLLQKDSQRKVLILEKREEYTRKHVVRFSAAKLTEFMEAIGAKGKKSIPELVELEKRLQENSAIRINELETILKKIALRMGAEIQYEEVKDVQKQIYDQYPKLERLIGCDGTHSTVSDQVFGIENQIKNSYDYVLQVRFEGTNCQHTL